MSNRALEGGHSDDVEVFLVDGDNHDLPLLDRYPAVESRPLDDYRLKLDRSRGRRNEIGYRRVSTDCRVTIVSHPVSRRSTINRHNYTSYISSHTNTHWRYIGYP